MRGRLLPFEIIVSGLADGTPGNDDYDGSTGNDTMRMQQGGDDDLFGDDGNDGFFFGAAFNALDRVDGGAGIDTLALQGDYHASPTVLAGVANTEVVLLVSGADTRFGDIGGNRYSYNLALSDANVAAGGMLTLQATALLPGENIVFDAAAERDGNLRVYPGQGIDALRGGGGNDGFFFGADGNLTGLDFVDGGAGIDSIALRGDYFGAGRVVFNDSSFTNIEVLTVLSSFTNEYGGGVTADGYRYDLTMADGNVAAGQRLDVIGGRLHDYESFIFDGRAELDGSFRVISGAGSDVIVDGHGNDQLFGGGGDDSIYALVGSDTVAGGAGNDQLYFGSNLDATDIVNGEADFDSLWIGGRDYGDPDFAQVSNIESIVIQTAGNEYRLDANAQRSGALLIADVSNGANLIDASNWSGYQVMGIEGGPGADILAGGNGHSNVYYYHGHLDSHGTAQDQIFGFFSGFDVIDATFLTEESSNGFQVNFVGNFSTEIGAQSAMPFNGKMNAAFVTSTHTLWFDTNNDHQLNDSDLSIILVGVDALKPEDVKHGAFVI